MPFYRFATTGYDEPDFSPAHVKILLKECPEEVFLNQALNEKPLLDLLLSREHKCSTCCFLESTRVAIILGKMSIS